MGFVLFFTKKQRSTNFLENVGSSIFGICSIAYWAFEVKKIAAFTSCVLTTNFMEVQYQTAGLPFQYSCSQMEWIYGINILVSMSVSM